MKPDETAVVEFGTDLHVGFYEREHPVKDETRLLSWNGSAQSFEPVDVETR